MNCLLNRDLEGASEFTSESWTDSNSGGTNETEPNESTDTGLLVAVIILAAIILLLFVGAGVAYLRYFRSVF
jgi:hypothetical protein